MIDPKDIAAARQVLVDGRHELKIASISYRCLETLDNALAAYERVAALIKRIDLYGLGAINVLPADSHGLITLGELEAHVLRELRAAIKGTP
jgi:hypothetical protein